MATLFAPQWSTLAGPLQHRDSIFGPTQGEQTVLRAMVGGPFGGTCVTTRPGPAHASRLSIDHSPFVWPPPFAASLATDATLPGELHGRLG